ncbi:MAG: superoxide dismutase family protein [Flavobacterium sp.]|nr:MAG: superoxide dismutase family protein [Flavobacterium sp.]
MKSSIQNQKATLFTAAKKFFIPALVVLAIAIACKSKSDSASSSRANVISVNLEPKSGSGVTGKATFKEMNGFVTFTANISGLKPGVHAIHIHEKADCSAADAASAGGHWNPTHQKHGKWGVGEYHRGDIGNFTTDEFGNGTISLTTDQWCIGCADESKNIIGKGIIVHEKADDLETQPSGNAGGRVACAAIIR